MCRHLHAVCGTPHGCRTHGLRFEQVFAPLFDESKAKVIHNVDDVGMQVSAKAGKLDPKVRMLIGGLAMPNMVVIIGQVKQGCQIGYHIGDLPPCRLF